jgi:hypothetical protein
MSKSERDALAYKLAQLAALLSNTVTADFHDLTLNAKAAYLHHCSEMAGELSEQLETA